MFTKAQASPDTTKKENAGYKYRYIFSPFLLLSSFKPRMEEIFQFQSYLENMKIVLGGKSLSTFTAEIFFAIILLTSCLVVLFVETIKNEINEVHNVNSQNNLEVFKQYT